ncbi:bidirectional sugar transporter SWEET1-like isoform X1 [Nicotiana tomentosiformis]|uniref:bidirectional sugar transporter SWEET1-like isoform X1 n=1 Tax=Nicotiana tomentosiformis TaxID=4098 RepID=UPI00388C6385
MANMGAAHTLHFALGIVGNITALILFGISPAYVNYNFFLLNYVVKINLFLFIEFRFTFWRIVTTQSTQNFSGIPYVMTMLNCLLSAWYGTPLISANNLLVTTTNGTGAAFALVYVLIFLKYAPNNERRKISALFFLNIAIYIAVALISMLGFHGNSRKNFCGIAATVVSILMYGSPLSIITQVIRTKSVEFMPFWLSFFVALSCGSWLTYAVIGKDLFIEISAGVGLILGIVQLILYTVYRRVTRDDNDNSNV